MSALERLYRRLLVLYPADFRAYFEEEMAEFFRDQVRDARQQRGWFGGTLSLLGAVGELVVSAARERLASGHGSSRRRRPSHQQGADLLDPLRATWRQAWRNLKHRPGLALAVIFTLALGISANTLVFAVVDAVLLRSLPYPEAARLVILWNRYETAPAALSPPDYADRRRESQLLESIAASTTRAMNLTGEAEPRRVEAARVTAGFFRVMGVEPLSGPAAFPDELSGDPERLAVLGFGLWQGAFGGDLKVVGTSIRLDGESYLVAGVMPGGFDYPPGSELYLPLVFTPEQLADDFRGNEYLTGVGRMRPGVELDQLDREMAAIAARVIERVPERRDFLERSGWGAAVVPLRERLIGEVRPALVLLMVAVLVVLLVTAANVAHLLLIGGYGRAHELIIHASLGATRPQLFAQLVCESVALALAGGLGGLLIAALAIGMLPRLLPGPLPTVNAIAVDPRALLFTLAVALAMGLACGWLPARHGSTVGQTTTVRASAGRGRRRLQRGLVVSQVAMAALLLVAAGLLVRSFERLSSRHPGFESKQRLAFGLDFPRSIYPEAGDRLALLDQLLAQLRVLPGVRAAAAAERIPLDGEQWTGTFHPEGYLPAPGEPAPGGDLNVVTADYLRTLGVPLRRGRDFAASDTGDSAQVVLVDDWVEQRFFHGGAVGRRINLNGPGQPPDWYEIVGVVGHVQYESLDEAGRFQLYFAAPQRWWRGLTFTLDTDIDAAVLFAYLRREVARLAPELAVHSVRQLDTLLSDSLAWRQAQTRLMVVFGALVLALAGVGIYGVLAHSVMRRTMEVGVRMALGASRGRVAALVVREGMVVVAFGVVLGTLAALSLSHLLSGLLYGVPPTDAVTYLAVLAALAAAATVATVPPALRASRLDPLRALRAD